MTRLRVLLPRLPSLREDTILPYAAYQRDDGAPVETDTLALAVLGQRWKGAGVDAILHPADVTMTDVGVPPLPTAQMRTAVLGMAEPYMLGDPSSSSIGHGKRSADGRVAVAWVHREDAAATRDLFDGLGLVLRTLLPAPFSLPAPDIGWTARLNDGHVIVRTGAGNGFALPMDAGSDAPDAGGLCMDQLRRQIDLLAPQRVAWLDAVPTWWPAVCAVPATVLSTATCWTAPRAPWSIEASEFDARTATASGWGRAIAWCVTAALAWMIGLNLYAARLEHAGKELQARNVERVREAFPALRTVMDPLRQARQQRDAQLTAGGHGSDAELAFLLGAARTSMSFAEGQVQAMRFADGALELDLVRGAPGAPSPPTLTAAATPPNGSGAASSQSAGPTAPPAWAAAAQQLGVEVEATGTGWRLRRAAEGSTMNTRPAVAATLARSPQ